VTARLEVIQRIDVRCGSPSNSRLVAAFGRRAVLPLLAVTVERHSQDRPDWMPGGNSRGFKDERIGQSLNLIGVSR
jgi:hypothetical protein